MNQTVDFETAKELRAAGFPQGEDVLVPDDRNRSVLRSVSPSIKMPTALEIIEQMPHATIDKLITGEWACYFPLPNNYMDYRQDPCPHRAAALAFIAWKKGSE